MPQRSNVDDVYPSDEVLEAIKNYPLITEPVQGLLELVRQNWRWSDYCKLSGKRILRLELHTGGWSGNEDLVHALAENKLFWILYWTKSLRGGHYYFRIPLRKGVDEESNRTAGQRKKSLAQEGGGTKKRECSPERGSSDLQDEAQGSPGLSKTDSYTE